MEKILTSEEKTILMLEAVRQELRALTLGMNLAIALAFKEEVDPGLLSELRQRGTDSMRRSSEAAHAVLGREVEE